MIDAARLPSNLTFSNPTSREEDIDIDMISAHRKASNAMTKEGAKYSHQAQTHPRANELDSQVLNDDNQSSPTRIASFATKVAGKNDTLSLEDDKASSGPRITDEPDLGDIHSADTPTPVSNSRQCVPLCKDQEQPPHAVEDLLGASSTQKRKDTEVKKALQRMVHSFRLTSQHFANQKLTQSWSLPQEILIWNPLSSAVQP